MRGCYRVLTWAFCNGLCRAESRSTITIKHSQTGRTFHWHCHITSISVIVSATPTLDCTPALAQHPYWELLAPPAQCVQQGLWNGTESVHPSVCPSMGPQQNLLLWVWHAGNTDRCCSSGGKCHTVSVRKQLNTDFTDAGSGWKALNIKWPQRVNNSISQITAKHCLHPSLPAANDTQWNTHTPV